MQKHNLQEMVTALRDRGLIEPERFDDVVNALESTWRHRIAIVWDIYDIRQQAGLSSLNLSDQDCMYILQQVQEYHDATVGINWDVLDYHIDQYIGKNPKLERQVIERSKPNLSGESLSLLGKDVKILVGQYQGKIVTVIGAIDDDAFVLDIDGDGKNREHYNRDQIQTECEVVANSEASQS